MIGATRFALAALVLSVAVSQAASGDSREPSFLDDLVFLKQHTGVLVLKAKEGPARLVISPAWQGRVMSSSATGDAGRSFGWINRDLIASHAPSPHIHAYGGEDRLWLGPEGGQFSIFFAPGEPFDYAHWYVPKPLDTLAFRIVSRRADRATFRAEFALTNYSGTHFQVAIEREVRLLPTKAAWHDLGLPPTSKVSLVAYESNNTLTNNGTHPWTRETGLLSIWILGMFIPSPSATIVVPIKPGPESELGVEVTSDYFGPIPPDRLKVSRTAIYLRADGTYRSKIGINPQRGLGKLGSYDADHHVLTIVEFNQPAGLTDYVNSQWKLQSHPFTGDVINAYNDGPAEPGAKPLGPFYEMESSSPAAALIPHASIEHTRRTFHLTGTDPELDLIARSVLGVTLADVEHAFHAD